MFGNLFINAASSLTLLEFGKAICPALGIVGFTERESSNYPDGRYLLAQCLGVSISLAMTDDDDLAEYPFQISFKADGFWIEDGTALEGLADVVARKLTLAGYKVARCPDYGLIGADIWRYSVKAGSLGSGRNEIDVAKLPPQDEPL